MDTIRMASCGCCSYKDSTRIDAFGHPYGCICHNHMDIPNGIVPGKCSLHQEHRGSRPYIESVDPLFHDAAGRGFEPETPDQAEAFREKLQGFPQEMKPRIERYLGGRR